MASATVTKRIWTALMNDINNAYGVAGLMGNLDAESGCTAANLQNSYEKSLGMTDAEYTAAVDDGSYTNFVKDSAGYGLAQWTYYSRKQNLLNYIQGKKLSIGDETGQIEFMLKELKESYSSVYKTLTGATTIKEASDAVLTKYENPADQSDSVKSKRESKGQTFYDKYATISSNSSSSSSASTTLASASKKESGHENGKKFTTTARLNFRYGPSSTKYASMLVIPKGDKVTWYGYYDKDSAGDKWYLVTYSGKTGWVHSGYLK